MKRQGTIIKPNIESDLPDDEIKPYSGYKTDKYFKVWETIKNKPNIPPIEIVRITKIPSRTVTDKLNNLLMDGVVERIDCPCGKGILYKPI